MVVEKTLSKDCICFLQETFHISLEDFEVIATKNEGEHENLGEVVRKRKKFIFCQNNFIIFRIVGTLENEKCKIFAVCLLGKAFEVHKNLRKRILMLWLKLKK